MVILDSVSVIQNIMLASNLLVQLFVTVVFMPNFITRLIENEIVAKDYYEKILKS